MTSQLSSYSQLYENAQENISNSVKIVQGKSTWNIASQMDNDLMTINGSELNIHIKQGKYQENISVHYSNNV